ncbi:MAG: MBL fold metallo-hydrolase, partial [Anaerolineales bacterium]|nr:MBL fold metallo-hydrolase [Anaerolineales bacterium]
GTSNAIPDEEHENTHLLVITDHRRVLIDCVNSPILRLKKVGVNFHDLTDLILTHFHPDHVAGVPQLLMDMWLMGRRRPLNIYGLHYTLDRIERLMEFYGWSEWPDFFPVAFYRIPSQEMMTVLDCQDVCIYASPVKHMIPCIGLRMEFKPEKKIVAYSSDTEPCAQVIRLAKGVDILIHEASGALLGHSSASQAGDVARQAEVGALYLVHYPTGPFASGNPVEEASRRYPGPVTLAEDFMVVEI